MEQDLTGGMGAMTPAAEMLGQGKALQRTQTQFTTAITVQKPRDIEAVRKAVLKEAEFAGSNFFYSWTVNTKTGPKTIQGPSIGLAMCVGREWTNCATDIEVGHLKGEILFFAYFIDVEKGFTVKRAYKYTPTAPPGKYDAQRWADMEFGKAQSKAVRNAVVAGLPSWLVDEAKEVAILSELNKINTEGLEKAKENSIVFFSNYGIGREEIIEKLGKPVEKWTPNDIIILRGYANDLKDGADRRQIFPLPDQAQDKAGELTEKFTQGAPPPESPQPEKPLEDATVEEIIEQFDNEPGTGGIGAEPDETPPEGPEWYQKLMAMRPQASQRALGQFCGAIQKKRKAVQQLPADLYHALLLKYMNNGGEEVEESGKFDFPERFEEEIGPPVEPPPDGEPKEKPPDTMGKQETEIERDSDDNITQDSFLKAAEFYRNELEEDNWNNVFRAWTSNPDRPEDAPPAYRQPILESLKAALDMQNS